jgi:xylulokinase
MKTVLGIDLGTQSLKVVFYDYEARRVAAAAAAPLELLRDDTGRAEQEADWWLSALAHALSEVPAGVRASVRAIGVSGQQHGFVAVDGRGRVVAPVKLWCDTSTQQEAEEITAACGGRARCIALTGNPVLTGYTAPKIRWLSKQRPERYGQMTHILLPHDYLNFALTGRLVMEPGDASGTNLLDVRTRNWCEEMLRAVDPSRDLAECLPPLCEPRSFVGETTGECEKRFGLPSGVPVAPGGGDNMMAAVGTGNVAPGRLTMSLGTSGTLFAHSETPVIDESGNIAAFCGSTGAWLPLVCTMNCTLATELVRAPLGVPTERFDEVVGAVAPGSDGVIVLPFFTGERTPNLPRARASVLGLSAQNCTQSHLLRATVEGATFGLKFGLDELAKLGVEAEEIVVTGGGARSQAWCQIVADVCRLPVTVLALEEGASFGAALQALWMLERQSDESVAIADITDSHLTPRHALCKEPEEKAAARYDDVYRAYRRATTDMITSHGLDQASDRIEERA